jgi:hypothetical protein
MCTLSNSFVFVQSLKHHLWKGPYLPELPWLYCQRPVACVCECICGLWVPPRPPVGLSNTTLLTAASLRPVLSFYYINSPSSSVFSTVLTTWVFFPHKIDDGFIMLFAALMRTSLNVHVKWRRVYSIGSSCAWWWAPFNFHWSLISCIRVLFSLQKFYANFNLNISLFWC